MKKVKKDDNSKKLNTAVVVVLLLLALFVSVICIELIIIHMIDTNNNKYLNKKEDFGHIFDNDFLEINVGEYVEFIDELCKEDRCYLKVNALKNNPLYYVIYNDNGSYSFSVYGDNKSIISSKKLGDSIKNAYFVKYNNNVVLFNIINDNGYEYDELTLINDKGNYDIFSSIAKDEIKLTDSGIVYYYDACNELDNNNNAQRVQAVRMPFSKTPSILKVENVYYEWCKKS